MFRQLGEALGFVATETPVPTAAPVGKAAPVATKSADVSVVTVSEEDNNIVSENRPEINCTIIAPVAPVVSSSDSPSPTADTVVDSDTNVESDTEAPAVVADTVVDSVAKEVASAMEEIVEEIIQMASKIVVERAPSAIARASLAENVVDKSASNVDVSVPVHVDNTLTVSGNSDEVNPVVPVNDSPVASSSLKVSIYLLKAKTRSLGPTCEGVFGAHLKRGSLGPTCEGGSLGPT